MIAPRPDLLAALKELRGFEIVPDAGHWSQIEATAAVNAALLRFLATMD